MFTRCPACRTVFHITAAELRAADGTVICGACDTTFDALDTLSETRPVDSEPAGVTATRGQATQGSAGRGEPRNEGPGLAGAAPVVPPAEEPPLEAIDLDEARDEDDFLEELESLIGGDDGLDDPFTGTGTDTRISPASASSVRTDPGDVGFGATRSGLTEQELAAAALDEGEPGDFQLDDTEPDDVVLDEALPDVSAGRPEWEPTTGLEEEEYRSGEVDFEIVEASLEDHADDRRLANEFDEADGRLLADGPDHADDRTLADEFEEDLPDPDSVFRVDDLDDEIAPTPGVSQLGAAGIDAVPAAAMSPAGPVEDPDFDDPDDEPAAPHAGGPLRQGSGRTAPALETEPDPEFVREPRRGRGWRRFLLALLALLLLGGTWAHSQHGKLLRHPLGETVLLPVYGLLGMEVAPDWDPSAYRAVHWEAVAERDRPGYLTVGVDFQNTAGFAQPYPVIRIVLEDRFGQRLGTHDAVPDEYLRAHASGARLPAGGRVRTTVMAPDPGARADGFRVDFCLEVHGRGLVCGPEPFR